MRKLWTAFGLVALLLFTGCGTRESEVPARPNVVLLTIDTLRADRLGAYGNDAGLTPHLDRIAREGVVFENASTVAPLTLPAHASILTGTYPLHHGIRDNGGYHLAPESETLAEILAAEGYATAAFVGAFVLDSRWGLDQGFERYYDDFDFSTFEDTSLGSVQRSGDEVIAEALRFLEEAKSRPFFAWIHLYDPHAPYDPPEPYRTRHGGRKSGLYDGEVAFTDDLAGRLLSWLERESLADDTLFFVIGDHGEALEEHGELDHGFFVYDATMRVPFLARIPGLEGSPRRVKAQVRVVDLVPTVLDLLRLPAPEAVQGVSLEPLLTGAMETLALRAYGESHYPRLHYGWSELRSLRDESFHFIDAPRPELYDLRNDPGETRNLAPERPGAVSELRRELQEIVERFSAASKPLEPVELDDETREKLLALGYLGSAGARGASEPGSSSLPDPKDKIELHRLVKQAEVDAGAGRLQEALRSLERVLGSDPDVVEAHRIRGDVHEALRDPASAAAAYREALSRDPEYKVAAFGLAMAELELGRLDSAEAGLRWVLQLDPRDNKSYFLLARILAARRDCPAALSVLDQAIAATRDTAPFEVSKAECYLTLEDLESAEASARKALEQNRKTPRAHLMLGLVRERRGDVARAIEAYETELASFPHDPRTFLQLSQLYRRTGRPSDELRVLESAVAAVPRSPEAHIFLARACLEAGQLDRAGALVQKGLQLSASPELSQMARGLLAELARRRTEDG